MEKNRSLQGKEKGKGVPKKKAKKKGGAYSKAFVLLDFIPVIGNVKSAIEATTGVDYSSGAKLGKWDRLLLLGSVAVGPFSKGVRYCSQAIKVSKVLKKLYQKNAQKGTQNTCEK